MPKKTYTQINSVTLAAASASVSFASIPQNFRDLILVVRGPALTSSEGDLFAIVNGDTGANYSRVYMLGEPPSTASGSNSGESQLRFGYYHASEHNTIAQFMDYSASDKHKTVLSRSNNSGGAVFAWASRWANTAPITSLLIDTTSAGSFSAGSTFTLYGIEA